MLQNNDVFEFHFYRKESPSENKITFLPSAPAVKCFDSPPPTRRNLDVPPPLVRHRYRNPIRTSAEEDSEKSSDSDGDEIKTYVRTYNLRRLAGVRDEDTNSKTTKSNQPRGTARELRATRKREAKATETRNLSPTKRTKKATGLVSRSTSAPAKCSTVANASGFSELYYLESIGSIRTIRRAKHPNINKVPISRTEIATPFVSPESQNGWDRKTKLKISYRVNLLKENDIQFALIIYEPVTMLIRRNLLEEFEKAANEEGEQQRNATATTTSSLVSLPSTPTPIDSNQSDLLKTPIDRCKNKTERPMSLRRLRF